MATPDHNNHADIPMRSLTTDSKTHATTHTRTQPLVAEHRGGTHYVRNDRSRTRRTQEVPFIAGCSHFTRKVHGFVLRLPPRHKPHATFMQPLQSHHFPKSPVSSVTTSLRHHLPSLRHYFPVHHFSPKPPHSLRHHFPKSRHSLCHHLPSSPLPWASHSPSMSILFWCLCDVNSHTALHQCQVPCDVLLRDAKSRTTFHQCQCFCNVLLCDAKSHTTLHQRQVLQFYLSVVRKYYLPTSFDDNVKSHTTLHWVNWCVIWSLTPPFIECIVMWCKVSHHPSLSVLLCDVKSHNTLHWVYCYVMWSLTQYCYVM